MNLIPEIREDVLARNIARARERNIVLPTFAQQKDPGMVPAEITAAPETDRPVGPGPGQPVPDHLEERSDRAWRWIWRRQLDRIPIGTDRGGCNHRRHRRQMVSHRLPTRSARLMAAWCRAWSPGNFDPTTQKAVWPSTGNYCRGGAYDCALLACPAVAILPEGMSRERFEWLKEIGTDEIIATPGTESNVKEIYDKCWELRQERGDDVVIFNQFEEFGNAIWHYHVTGSVIDEVFDNHLRNGPPPVGLRQRHRFGRHHRRRRFSADPASRDPGGGRGSPAVPHPASVRLRRAPHRGHRRQARSLDSQRAQHRHGRGHRRRTDHAADAAVQRARRPRLPAP